MSVTLERFEKHTERLGGTAEHWLWLGGKTAGGKYGVMFIGRGDGRQHNVAAHRWAWEYYRGEIPKGRVLTPNCEPKGICCVNPWHYDMITKSESSARAASIHFNPDKPSTPSSENGAAIPPEDCLHHWIIAAPNGPMSTGVCKNCNEERNDFVNSIPSVNDTSRNWRKGKRVKDKRL